MPGMVEALKVSVFLHDCTQRDIWLKSSAKALVLYTFAQTHPSSGLYVYAFAKVGNLQFAQAEALFRPAAI